MAEPAEEQRALEAEVDGMDTGELHSAVESEKKEDRKRAVKELVSRAFNASGSAVRLIIHPLDPEVEWCLTVRFCDSSFNRKVDGVDMWKFQEGEINQRELFCSFAPSGSSGGLVWKLRGEQPPEHRGQECAQRDLQDAADRIQDANGLDGRLPGQEQ